MKLVIDIPKSLQHKCGTLEVLNSSDIMFLEEAVRSGTPLPKGHWKPFAISYYRCDICGTIKDRKLDTCPNCGADMREESEE